MKNNRKTSAAEWFAQASAEGAFCGRQEPASRSAYTGPQIGDVTTVEQWDGQRFVERRLVWDGGAYVPEVAK